MIGFLIQLSLICPIFFLTIFFIAITNNGQWFKVGKYRPRQRRLSIDYYLVNLYDSNTCKSNDDFDYNVWISTFHFCLFWRMIWHIPNDFVSQTDRVVFGVDFNGVKVRFLFMLPFIFFFLWWHLASFWFSQSLLYD